MSAVVLLLLIFLSIDANAQNAPVQINWVPDRFEVFCEPGWACPLGPEKSAATADMMSQAVAGMKDMPFAAPKKWGERVGQGTDNDRVRLYQIESVIAEATPACAPDDNVDYGYMKVGSGLSDSFFAARPYLLYYFMAHEVFHLTQYDYPFYNSVRCQSVPDWIMESTATAIGLEAMRRNIQVRQPPRGPEREAVMLAGLRRYDQPLPYRPDVETPGDKTAYLTASFWRHLAQVYHDGNYAYLHEYMQMTGGQDGWVNWLRTNIELNSDNELGMVFSGFLADYAGWGDNGYPGAWYGRKTWLERAFGGCKKILLDKTTKHQSVELTILPLSGQCVEVEVAGNGENGLKADDLASIQVAAVTSGGRPGADKGLYLGLATSNAAQPFHCARNALALGERGIKDCLWLADDGELHLAGLKTQARVWNIMPSAGKRVISEHSGNLAVKQQKLGMNTGLLTNLYTVSYTPDDVSDADTRNGGRDPIKVEMFFVLDVPEEHASMGKGNASGIIETLPIEFDVRQATFSRARNKKVGDNYVGTDFAEGVINPCHITVNMRNSKTNESINFTMLHPGAITPGDYPFANRMDFLEVKDYYVPEGKVPGMVLGTIKAKPAGNSKLRAYSILSGTLSIDSISGSLASGNITANAAILEREKTPDPWIIREQQTFTTTFALEFRYPMAFGQTKPYACFSP